LEVGLPYSDPSADGPVLQRAAKRVLDNGTSIAVCLEILAAFRRLHDHIPIGMLVYANLVCAPGVKTFYKRCAKAGVDSVLVADLPLEEAAPFCEAAQDAGIAPVFIAPPNCDCEQIRLLAQRCRGYTYVMSRSGVTGTEKGAGSPPAEIMQWLREFSAPPAVVGFGISKPADVRRALASGARGAISGSAVVKMIEENLSQPEAIPGLLEKSVNKMKAATLELHV